MTTRKITPKGFLQKSSSAKISAGAFLDQYRDYLLTGELASITSPILSKVSSGELMPTPALGEVRNAVFAHIMAQSKLKAEKAEKELSKKQVMFLSNKNSELSSGDHFSVEILNSRNEVKLSQKFDKCSEGERWLDRKLFEGECDWFAKCTLICGDKSFSEVVKRDESIERTLKVKHRPTMKRAARSSGGISFGVKVHNDTCHFSRG